MRGSASADVIFAAPSMPALVAKATEENGTNTRRGSEGSSKGKGKSSEIVSRFSTLCIAKATVRKKTCSQYALRGGRMRNVGRRETKRTSRSLSEKPQPRKKPPLRCSKVNARAIFFTPQKRQDGPIARWLLDLGGRGKGQGNGLDMDTDHSKRPKRSVQLRLRCQNPSRPLAGPRATGATSSNVALGHQQQSRTVCGPAVVF